MNKKITPYFLTVFLILFISFYIYISYEIFLDKECYQKKDLYINNHIIHTELVCSNKERSLGLMNRMELKENNGMLFIFPSSDRYSFWMKNTYIPLSIAYIDEDLVIQEIYNMTPLNETPIPSKNKFKYALEVNLNWFKNNNISIGDKLTIK